MVYSRFKSEEGSKGTILRKPLGGNVQLFVMSIISVLNLAPTKLTNEFYHHNLNISLEIKPDQHNWESYRALCPLSKGLTHSLNSLRHQSQKRTFLLPEVKTMPVPETAG